MACYSKESSMYRMVIGTLTLVALFSSLSLEAKVYKWVDENGKVHYSDKPFNKGEKELNIKSNISPEKAAKAKAEAQLRLQKLQRQVNSVLADQRSQKNAKAKSNQEQKKIDHVCGLIEKQLKLLNQQVRIVETDKQGEMKFLSDEQRAAQISKLKELQKNNCSN